MMKKYGLSGFVILLVLFSCKFVSAQSCDPLVVRGQNLVRNGDFEQGECCFTVGPEYTHFSESPVDWSTPGHWMVGNNPQEMNDAFCANMKDNFGGSKYLLIDAACEPQAVFWEQEVEIQPNTYYYFSAWATSMMWQSVARLRFTVNGQNLGGPFEVPNGCDNWKSFTDTFFSGNMSGKVKIRMVNLKTDQCHNGEDFVIDNIKFIPGCAFAGGPSPVPDLPDAPISICDFPNGITLDPGLSGAGNISFSWNTGATSPTITVTEPGKYAVCVSEPGKCPSTDTVLIVTGDPPLPKLQSSQSQCTPVTVSAWNTGNLGNVNHEWYVDGELVSTDPTLPDQVFVNTGTATEEHTIKLVVSNGCGSSSDEISIQVLPGPQADAGDDVTLCQGMNATLNATGGVSYQWSPPTFLTCTNCQSPVTTPGNSITYTVTVTDDKGCTATDQVVVNIGTQLSINAGPDETICEGSEIRLSATNVNGAQYQWAPTLGLSCTNCPNPVASPAATTTYIVNAQMGSCSGSDEVVVSVVPPPVADAGEDRQSCVGETVSLTAAGGSSYQWSNGATTSTIAVVPSANTIYRVSVYEGNCFSTDEVNVSLYPEMSIDPVIQAECGIYTISANISGSTGPYSYQWSAGGATTQTVGDLRAGDYSLTVTDGYGCKKVENINIPVVSRPAIEAGGDLVVCEGGSIQIQTTAQGGRAPYTFTWKPAGSLNDPSVQDPVASPAVTTTYSVTVTDSEGCSDSDKVVVSVEPLPEAAFSGDPLVGCEPLPVRFTDESTSGGYITNWLWDFGDGTTSTEQHPVHVYENSGSYSVTLTVTSANNCSATETINNYVTVLARPVAAFTADPLVATIENPVIRFNNNSTNYEIVTWAMGDGNGYSDPDSFTHTYSDTGKYTVTLIAVAENGCSDTAEKIIRIDPYFKHFVPNVFTPNKDGVNDEWIGVGIFDYVESYEFSIWNRWGEKIYGSDDYTPWNGRYHNRGKEVKDGAYVYLVKLTFQGKEYEYKGTVLVLK